MVSKTAMLALVKGFRAAEVDAALRETPKLKEVRDERGRNWLHVACGTKPPKGREKDSIETVKVLLKHGFDMNAPAFIEGSWKATPVWYCIGRGENLALAEFLLKRGADPNHSLWAANFRGDLVAIRLLVKHGADLEAVAENTTPFLGAVSWSKFAPAEELLKLGANPNYIDHKGMTALHYMLKKDSDAKHIAMVVRHGARGDIKNREGVTAVDLLRRKRNPALRKLADMLAASA
jgi:ankyrin repeat protein